MLFRGDNCSLLPQLLQAWLVMHVQEEPLTEYAQSCLNKQAENQARLKASGLRAMCDALEEATKPAAKKGKKRRADQENIPKVLCACGRDANTCCAQSRHGSCLHHHCNQCTHVRVTALLGNTVASALQAVPGSDRTLRALNAEPVGKKGKTRPSGNENNPKVRICHETCHRISNATH